MTALCTTGIASFTFGENLEDALTSIRAKDIEVSAGGIAGVSYQEAFENGFTYGFGCGQNGWTCQLAAPPVPAGDFEIIDAPDPAFLLFTLQDTAAGHGQGVQEARSPLFLLEPGQLHADIIISDNASLYQLITVNGTTAFFNTRLNFEANGTMRALQIQGAPPCTVGVFANTTGSWTPGVKMRIGVEVLAGNILRVYKNGVQVFQGHDISQFCNAGNPAIGISQIRNFNSNVGTSTTFQMDNISQAPVVNLCTLPLPFCRADVFPAGGDALVNIDDLLVVIGSWGQNGNPAGPRPAGDCAPGAAGDCLVNIDDILAIISGWGVCPVPTGACCIQGVCSVISQASCASQFGFFQGQGTDCTAVVCPVSPPNDLCGNALVATNGANNWNNANANNDGGTPPQSCFPNGGGVRGDVWFKYTATCTGNVTFDTVGTAAPFTDTFLQVFNTHACPPGVMLGCNDDIDFGATNFLSRLTIAMASGQQCLVRCASNSASPAANSGAAVLNIACNIFNNDFCEDAPDLSVPGTVSASIQGATVEDEPNCLPGNPQPAQGRGRWYKVLGNGNTLTASTCTSPLEFSWDGRLAVYCGLNCPDLTCVVGSQSFDCGPSGVTQTGLHERVTWCSKNGQNYWILVAGDIVPLPPEGNYTLVVSNGAACANAVACGLAPANDNCANAVVINNGTTSYSTVFASTDGTLNAPLPPGVDCNDSGATQTVADIWYRYTATCNGFLTVTTCSQVGGNSNYDSDLVLYSGSAACPPNPSSIISCNDDDDDGNACGAAPPWSSTLHANVTTGSTFLLRVGGFQTPTDIGTGVINITCVPAVCGNGILEPGEQCDDNNGVPNDGCTNCQIDPNCAPACTVTPVEACVEGPDTVNGGCNTTPALYTPIALAGGTAVICGQTWATEVGTVGNRDLDWYTVTVGASGRVEGHITATTLMPVLCFVGNATGPPGGGVCSNTNVVVSEVALQGQCKVAVRSGLTPGSTALVIAAPNTFTGFPCSGGPWTYKLRILSP